MLQQHVYVGTQRLVTRVGLLKVLQPDLDTAQLFLQSFHQTMLRSMRRLLVVSQVQLQNVHGVVDYALDRRYVGPARVAVVPSFEWLFPGIFLNLKPRVLNRQSLVRSYRCQHFQVNDDAIDSIGRAEGE